MSYKRCDRCHWMSDDIKDVDGNKLCRECREERGE